MDQLLDDKVRTRVVGIDVGRIVRYIESGTARDVLWMYRVFGLLTMST